MTGCGTEGAFNLGLFDLVATAFIGVTPDSNDDHVTHTLNSAHDQRHVWFRHAAGVQDVFEHISHLIEMDAMNMEFGMGRVHVAAGVNLCWLTHDIRHVFHRVLSQMGHVNAFEVGGQMVTAHDFFVESPDQFRDGGHTAVFVEQGHIAGIGFRLGHIGIWNSRHLVSGRFAAES